MAQAAREQGLSVAWRRDVARAAALALACGLLVSAASAQVTRSQTRSLTTQEKAALAAALRASANRLDLSSVQAWATASASQQRPWRLEAQVWSRPVADPDGFCRADQFFYERDADRGAWALERGGVAHNAWMDGGGHCAKRPKDTVALLHDVAAPTVALILRQPGALRDRLRHQDAHGCESIVPTARLSAIDGDAAAWLHQDASPADTLAVEFTEVTTEPGPRTVVAVMRVRPPLIEFVQASCLTP
jgi:hypothetical protein